MLSNSTVPLCSTWHPQITTLPTNSNIILYNWWSMLLTMVNSLMFCSKVNPMHSFCFINTYLPFQCNWCAPKLFYKCFHFFVFELLLLISLCLNFLCSFSVSSCPFAQECYLDVSDNFLLTLICSKLSCNNWTQLCVLWDAVPCFLVLWWDRCPLNY